MKFLNAWVKFFYGPNGDGAPFGTLPDADLNFGASLFMTFVLVLLTLWGLAEGVSFLLD